MTTFEVKDSANYAAEIIEVKGLVELPGLDNLVGLAWAGYTALVPRTTQVGDIMVIFPAEAQLSHEFASFNNLYRHNYDFESAIMAVWENQHVRTTKIAPLVYEAYADLATLSNSDELIPSTPSGSAQRTGNIESVQSPGKSHQSEVPSGSVTTRNVSSKSRSSIETDTRKTSATAENSSHQRSGNASLGGSTLLNTASLPNGMSSDTLTLEDVANYVRSGGKFSALTTAILREWYGDSSVKDATSLLVALGTMQKVFAGLSRTSNVPQFSDFANNADPEAVGYLEDNRRVRAIKLRGHRSSALALSLGSIMTMPHPKGGGWLMEQHVYDSDDLVGTQFDTINGVEISRKYELPVKANSTAGKSQQEKMWRRVDDKFLPEHIETDNWMRNEFKVPEDAWITVSQKIHGTSWRGGQVIVKRHLTWLERLARKFGVKVPETEYDYVFGSRKVIKDPHNPRQDHFYSTDIWTEFGRTIENLLPKGVVVYGELVGYTPEGAPIQTGYTYDVTKDEGMRLYVYRVAVVTEDGVSYDLPRAGVEQFCLERGLSVVPLLWQGFKRDFVAEDWLDKNYWPEYPQAVPLSKDSVCDEGVVIQVEGIVPQNYKHKSPAFLGFETQLLDKDVEVLS